MNQKYLDIALSIVFIIVSVLLYGSADTGSNAVSQASKDSTMMYVNFIALALGIAAFAQLILTFVTPAHIIEFTKQPKKFFAFAIALVIYIFVMDYIGFTLSSMLFLPIVMRMMGYEKLVLSIVVSAGITLFVYLLFEVGFDIVLPEFSLLERILE